MAQGRLGRRPREKRRQTGESRPSINVLAELRRRIAATRWPDPETVTDESQGVPLAMIRELARYWAADYDWRRCEATLNALPHFVTEIDGLDIHFIHVRSRHEDALPLIVTHGWPGSIIEQLKIVGPLTDPTAHGAAASDAFHLVIPSLPGYGFSGKPRETGWDPARIARAWVVLMKRLGYTAVRVARRRLGRGGHERDGPAGSPGAARHPRQLPGHGPARRRQGAPATATRRRPALSAEEKHAYEQLTILYARRRAYAAMMGTRPQTLYGLADSPVGLAAWLLDHGDGWGQPAGAGHLGRARAHQPRHPAGDLTRDDVLDNITLYWLTNTAVSSARLYWENKLSLYNAADVCVPAAVSAFPGENYQAPRSWARAGVPQPRLLQPARPGGHFAAWEQPQLFAAEVRAGLKPLRK